MPMVGGFKIGRLVFAPDFRCILCGAPKSRLRGARRTSAGLELPLVLLLSSHGHSRRRSAPDRVATWTFPDRIACGIDLIFPDRQTAENSGFKRVEQETIFPTKLKS